MIGQERLYDLMQLLESRSVDLRAEVLVHHLMEGGLGAQEFVVKQQEFFSREYVKDISRAQMVENEWYVYYLELELSRAGFYDMLPESLFHQPQTKAFRERAGVSEMINSYKVNAEIEKGVRKFFQPLENEYFQQQLMLEKEEVSLLDALRNRALTAYFLKFWGLPVSFGAREAASFLLLLPYASQINGNIPLTEACLKLLLKEQVSIRRKAPEPIQVQDDAITRMGQPLGDYMVCGTEFFEDYPVLSYEIGPLKHSRVSDYIEGGGKEALIRVFNEYFAPVEADITIEIIMDKKTPGMSFEDGVEVILGYSSIM
ncbi:hypothetical protein GCM10027051_15230 [Niabella terrae]